MSKSWCDFGAKVKTGSKGSLGWKQLAALSVSSLSKALVNPLIKECAWHEHFKLRCVAIHSNSTPQFQPENEDAVKKEENPCQQMVESVTSDLTCSITSDLSQVGFLYCYISPRFSFIICISYNLFQNTLKDEDSNAFWNRSSFKETNIYQEQTHSRSLSYKERNKSIITTSPSNQTPVLSPQPPSPPCTKPPEDENNCPTLDINDTKTFTDYYSFPPITLIDDLEVWDEEDDE